MGSKGYRDAFRSTASYYARYRAAYPPALFDLLRGKFGLDGTGRLLDLGCGTGQLVVPLAGDFEEVVAMDPEPEMLAEGERIAHADGVTNVVWRRGSSEDLEDLRSSLGAFRLVTFGNSFHWTDRDATLRALHETVVPGGGIAVVGSGGSDSRWTPPETPAVQDEVVKRWLGERRRAGSGFYDVSPERHEEIVGRSRFAGMEIYPVPDRRELTINDLVGGMYSTSFASPSVLAEKRAGFEADLRASLAALAPSGRFVEDVTYTAILAWRR